MKSFPFFCLLLYTLLIISCQPTPPDPPEPPGPESFSLRSARLNDQEIDLRFQDRHVEFTGTVNSPTPIVDISYPIQLELNFSEEVGIDTLRQALSVRGSSGETLDPRNLSDNYANYLEQAQHHSLINYEYCKANPRQYIGYSDLCWGLTASDGNNGYDAHSPTNDLGGITPAAAISSLPYTPTESMDALRFSTIGWGTDSGDPMDFMMPSI